MKIRDRIAEFLTSADAEFRRFQKNWASQERARREGYDEGYRIGYLRGQIEGYEKGREDANQIFLKTLGAKS